MDQFAPRPGWWQASDGQWYPPESHPSAAPTVVEPTQPGSGPDPTSTGWSAPQDTGSWAGHSQPTGPPTQAMPAQPSPYGTPTQQIPQTAAPTAPPYQAPPTSTYPGAPAQPPYAAQPGLGMGVPQGPYGAAPAYGLQPPAPQKSSSGKWILGIAAAVVVLSLIGGGLALVVRDNTGSRDVAISSLPGGGSDQDVNDGPSRKPDAPDATDEAGIIGSEGGEIGDVTAAAVADVVAFWEQTMPEVYDIPYEPLEGGVYSASSDEGAPPCAEKFSDIADNAYYCPELDVIVFDDESLIPRLLDTYGDLAVAVVLAHEWGHAIQQRSGMRGRTVTLEQQADCFAGAWVAHVADGNSDYFTAEGRALDSAVAGFLELADAPGTSAADPLAHGSAFDRINAFQDGFTEGASSCAGYTDENLSLVELPFQSQEDFNSGGNAPYADILDLTVADLENFWSIAAPEVFDTEWTPLAAPQPFDPADGAPDCGGDSVDGYTLFYCAPDRFVAFDNVELFPKVYEQIGDFAVASLFGTQFSLGVQDELGIAPSNSKEQNLLADCMVGGWAASIFQENRLDRGGEFVLSPGDFDEAVAVMLAFSGDESDDTHGTGIDRVEAFRTGVLGGVGACPV